MTRTRSSRLSSAAGAALVAITLSAAACKGSSSTTTAPTAPTATVETFSGTVAVRGRDAHNFTISRSGQVDVTLTAAAPPAGVALGVGIGLPGGSACSILPGASAVAAAGSTPAVSGVISAGTLCVVVYDTGSLTAPVTYTVTVSHF